jgi:hypothetical protein
MPVVASTITLSAKHRCAIRQIGVKRWNCLPRSCAGHLVDAHVQVAAAARLALLPFAEEPQAGVQPEEREGADQQGAHAHEAAVTCG